LALTIWPAPIARWLALRESGSPIERLVASKSKPESWAEFCARWIAVLREGK
jgi:hypothetical protein